MPPGPGEKRVQAFERQSRAIWAAAQNGCLSAIREALSKVGLEDRSHPGCLVSLYGSLARLEYSPGQSSVDIQPVLSESQAQRAVGLATDLRKFAEALEHSIKALEQELEKDYPDLSIEEMRKASPIRCRFESLPTDSVSGYQSLEGALTTHYSLPRLGGGVANQARLLWGSCFLAGDADLYDLAVTTMENRCRLYENLSEVCLPLYGLGLARSHMWSYVVARTEETRASQSMVPEGIAWKAILGGVWSASCIELSLHLLLWDRLINGAGAFELKAARELLQSPTQHKLAIGIPSLVSKLDSGMTRWATRRCRLSLQSLFRNEYRPKFSRIVEMVGLRSKGADTLQARFESLWSSVFKARAGCAIEPDDRARVAEANSKLALVLRMSARVTEGILMGSHLEPEIGDRSEAAISRLGEVLGPLVGLRPAYYDELV